MEPNLKLTLIQKLDQTTPSGIAALPEVAIRFKDIYRIMNGTDSEVAGLKYEAEKFHFSKLLSDKKELQLCTKLSLYGCFVDMAVNGLSFDPSMKHAYVVSFNANVGTKQSPQWEKRATLMISGYGELHMRMKQGQIKYADNPIIVYEGDHFQHGTKNGSVFLEHTACFPRISENIIASYIRIVRNDDSVDYKVLGFNEVMNLRTFSKDPNSLAWTKGLRGMVASKTIKHAFNSYPKTRMGEFSKLQSQVEAEAPIDYGLNNTAADQPQALPEAKGTFTPTMIVEPIKPIDTGNDFMQDEPAKLAQAGKTIEDEDF